MTIISFIHTLTIQHAYCIRQCKWMIGPCEFSIFKDNTQSKTGLVVAEHNLLYHTRCVKAKKHHKHTHTHDIQINGCDTENQLGKIFTGFALRAGIMLFIPKSNKKNSFSVIISGIIKYFFEQFFFRSLVINPV